MAAAGCAALGSPAWLRVCGSRVRELYAATELDRLSQMAPVARYWVSTDMEGTHCQDCHISEIGTGKVHRHDEIYVKCLLCPQSCVLRKGERGRCRARMNVNGELRSLVYGRPITTQVDPIEKKPFYHFLPGSAAFSLATSGCPLKCQFCQNWEISQIAPEDYQSTFISAAEIAASAMKRQAPVIAFTYNEPTVFTEYMLDIAAAGRAEGIRSVLISCGFINVEPLADICASLDAIKIDLKGFSSDFYRKVCSADLQPVLRSIKQISRSKTHLEIVNLVVPTLNDSEKMLNELCDWIIGEVGPDVPVHFTRFHPEYRLLNLSPTPVVSLELARSVAMTKGIRYAYVGNVPGHEGNHTYCPGCGRAIILRSGFLIQEVHLSHGNCEFCGTAIHGVWS